MSERPLRLTVWSDSTVFAGTERSLATVVAGLPPRVAVTVLGTDPAVVRAIAGERPGTAFALLAPIATKADVRAMVAFARALRAARPDVLHVMLPSPWHGRHIVFVALLLRVPVVVTEQLPAPAPTAWARRLKRLLARRVAAHVAVGGASAREVERLAGLAPGSVGVVHNAVDTGGPAPAPASHAPATVGTIARLDAQKGVDVLLAALARLPGVALEVVGDGPERAALAALAERLGVASRVTWAGWSTAPRGRLAAWSIFALASRHEAFPLAVLEAMVAGRAVVATDVGSVRDVLADGENGLLVAPEDPDALAAAIGRLLADGALRDRLGARARRDVLERFAPDAMVGRYLAIYEAIRAR